MLLRHLEQAERHVALGKRHIADQEQRVADLARSGHDTTEARKLLDNFYATQVQHIQHRDRILMELKQRSKAAPVGPLLGTRPARRRLDGYHRPARGIYR